MTPKSESVRATIGIIATTPISWFDPAKIPPAFDKNLLLMVGAGRSDDCGATWQSHTVVHTARIKKTSTGDEFCDIPAIEEYETGNRSDFLNYQFYLEGDDGNELDWYSDSIVAWAHYPASVGDIAINNARKRQQGIDTQYPSKADNDQNIANGASDV